MLLLLLLPVNKLSIVLVRQRLLVLPLLSPHVKLRLPAMLLRRLRLLVRGVSFV
jgi:hypothetical protein